MLKQKATNIWKTILHSTLSTTSHVYIKKQYIHSSHFGTSIIQITKAPKSTITSALSEGRGGEDTPTPRHLHDTVTENRKRGVRLHYDTACYEFITGMKPKRT